jgi:hypothetical protein
MSRSGPVRVEGPTRVLTSPANLNIQWDTSVFLAGGISGCFDWQSYAVKRLIAKKFDGVIINPRRRNGLGRTGDVAKKQIRWEHKYLEEVGCIAFWFPPETLCPIALFELGRWSSQVFTDKKILIGADVNYERRFDIEVQVRLERPRTKIVDSLDALVDQIVKYGVDN